MDIYYASLIYPSLILNHENFSLPKIYPPPTSSVRSSPSLASPVQRPVSVVEKKQNRNIFKVPNIKSPIHIKHIKNKKSIGA